MKIGKFVLFRDTAPARPEHYQGLDSVNERYETLKSSGKQLILGVLTARSGTRYLCRVFSEHKNATGVTERFVEAEAFWRYVHYNKLPIDTEGVLRLIKNGISNDWETSDVSLVFSPYFSHGLKEICEALRPDRLIFAISDPRTTVQSIYNKGLFKENYYRKDVHHALGYQPELAGSWSHFFGRLVPNGEEYLRWSAMTRVGKIAWWANRMTMDIIEQIQAVAPEKTFLFHLEGASQDYGYYKKMASYFGLTPVLSEEHFLSLKGKMTKATDTMPHVWTAEEEREFMQNTEAWRAFYEKLPPKETSFPRR